MPSSSKPSPPKKHKTLSDALLSHHIKRHVGSGGGGELVSEPDADSCHGNRHHFVHPAIFECDSSCAPLLRCRAERSFCLMPDQKERRRRKQSRRSGWRNDLINAGEERGSRSSVVDARCALMIKRNKLKVSLSSNQQVSSSRVPRNEFEKGKLSIISLIMT